MQQRFEVLPDIPVAFADTGHNRFVRNVRFGLGAPGEKQANGRDDGNASHGAEGKLEPILQAVPFRLVRENAIDGRGESVADAARKLGVSRAQPNRTLAGKGGVTPATALALEATGWGAAETWLRMQASHDLARLRRESVAA